MEVDVLVRRVVRRVQVRVRMRVPFSRRVPRHEGELVHVRLVRLVVGMLVRMVVGVDVRVIVRVDQFAVSMLVRMRMRMRVAVLVQVPGKSRLVLLLGHDGLLRGSIGRIAASDSATRRRRATGYRLARRRARAGSGSGTAASSIRV